MVFFLPDTSCMIAAVCSWHEHHVRAADAIEGRLERKERMIVAAPALLEMYSVLTRLPAPYRLAPLSALRVVEANFVKGVKIVALDAEAYVAILRDAPRAGIFGGRTYDAAIAACARKANVQTLLTFNESHFRPFSDPGLLVVVP
jgi:predicted nucleic acid-binding protein